MIKEQVESQPAQGFVERIHERPATNALERGGKYENFSNQSS